MGFHGNEKPCCFVAPLVLLGSHIWGVLFRPNVFTQHCLPVASYFGYTGPHVIVIIQKHLGPETNL